MVAADESVRAWRANIGLLIATLFLWALGGMTADILAVLFSAAMLITLVLVWMVVGIGLMLKSWKHRDILSKNRLLWQLAAFPVTAIALVMLAWPARWAVYYVDSAKYADLVNDQAFLDAAKKAPTEFTYDMHKIEIDKHGSNIRFALDRDGYVVRSYAYVYDSERDLKALTDTKEIEMFSYMLSHCRDVRQSFYYCSFS